MVHKPVKLVDETSSYMFIAQGGDVPICVLKSHFNAYRVLSAWPSPGHIIKLFKYYEILNTSEFVSEVFEHITNEHNCK